MKKTYMIPEVDVIKFASEDILTASGGDFSTTCPSFDDSVLGPDFCNSHPQITWG